MHGNHVLTVDLLCWFLFPTKILSSMWHVQLSTFQGMSLLSLSPHCVLIKQMYHNSYKLPECIAYYSVVDLIIQPGLVKPLYLFSYFILCVRLKSLLFMPYIGLCSCSWRITSLYLDCWRVCGCLVCIWSNNMFVRVPETTLSSWPIPFFLISSNIGRKYSIQVSLYQFKCIIIYNVITIFTELLSQKIDLLC